MKKYEEYKLIEILDFLNEYAYKPYRNPVHETDSMEQARLQDLKLKGQNALSLFKDMCISLEDKRYKNKISSKWLDGSNKYVRSYFWSQLKHQDKIHLPSSISIVAQKQGEKVMLLI